MNILDLIQNSTGITYKHKASTNGGEWAGPCFNCGGKDRMSIMPVIDKYLCRRCKRVGDTIQFFRDYHKQNYFEACISAGVDPKINYNSLDVSTERKGQNEIIWKPREINLPSDLWQKKATSFLFEAYKNLMSSAGKKHRDYLNSRGLLNSTIKIARLGLVGSNINFSKKSWGIVSENDEGSKNDKIWIPSGIIIPQFKNNKVIRIRVRQDEPIGTGRYIIVSGSATGYFNYDSFLKETNQPYTQISKPAFICEAELDGWLAYQESGDKFSIYSIGNSSARPDTETHDMISDKAIALNLDDDDAGKEEVAWWDNQYDNVVPCFTEGGKDLGESFEADIDIKNFLFSCLTKLKDVNVDAPLRPDTHIKNESFKDDVYENYKKKSATNIVVNNTEVEENNTKIVKKDIEEPGYNTINPVCLHNLFCISLKENRCLVDKEGIFQKMLDPNKKCPKEYWYKFTEEGSSVTQIILGIGVRK